MVSRSRTCDTVMRCAGLANPWVRPLSPCSGGRQGNLSRSMCAPQPTHSVKLRAPLRRTRSLVGSFQNSVSASRRGWAWDRQLMSLWWVGVMPAVRPPWPLRAWVRERCCSRWITTESRRCRATRQSEESPKGHLVKEIDALGGEMARNTDQAGIQFRFINTSKGPAVRALRVQCDKKLYRDAMQRTLRLQEGLTIGEGTVDRLLTHAGAITGVVTDQRRSHSGEGRYFDIRYIP